MFIKNAFRKLFPNLFYIARYVVNFRRLPNLKKPKTFNEKILSRILFSNERSYTKLSDKNEVKNWVSEKIGAQYVIQNIVVTDELSIKTINNVLEKDNCIFVKANHNSGPVFKLDRNSSQEERLRVANDVNAQLHIDYGKVHGEYWYSFIEPRIIIEKSLSECGDDILDYKFHCFNNSEGFSFVLHVDFDRNTDHNRSFFDSELNYLPFEMAYPSKVKSIERPKNWDLMIQIVRTLSAGFSYVRVDLYNVNGIIYFGEMTFAHEAGTGKFTPEKYDAWMGQLWE